MTFKIQMFCGHIVSLNLCTVLKPIAIDGVAVTLDPAHPLHQSFQLLPSGHPYREFIPGHCHQQFKPGSLVLSTYCLFILFGS